MDPADRAARWASSRLCRLRLVGLAAAGDAAGDRAREPRDRPAMGARRLPAEGGAGARAAGPEGPADRGAGRQSAPLRRAPRHRPTGRSSRSCCWRCRAAFWRRPRSASAPRRHRARGARSGAALEPRPARSSRPAAGRASPCCWRSLRERRASRPAWCWICWTCATCTTAAPAAACGCTARATPAGSPFSPSPASRSRCTRRSSGASAASAVLAAVNLALVVLTGGRMGIGRLRSCSRSPTSPVRAPRRCAPASWRPSRWSC